MGPGASHEFDNMMASITIDPQPIKAIKGVHITTGEIEKQALRARDCLVDVNYHKVRGTCGDERERIGLANGEPFVEPRPSAFGGPNIYSLYIVELTGMLADENASAEDNLRTATGILNAAGIPSGGHKRCAANASFSDVVMTIAEPENRESITDYAKKELGDDYDQTVMDEVFANAEEVATSGRFDDWDESVLERVLGEEAGDALEVLADVPHQARTLIKQKIPGKTVDQTRLHYVAGEDSFDVDEPYLDEIESALAAYSKDSQRWKRLMRHAREAVHAGIANAVPNEELHQISLSL